jgi:hypothetical protein
MPLQTETGAERDPRLNCERCKGEKLIGVRPADCYHQGNCPCGFDEIECPTCAGTGVVDCLNCGEDADRIGPDGEAYCSFGCSGGTVTIEGDDREFERAHDRFYDPENGPPSLREQYERAARERRVS